MIRGIVGSEEIKFTQAGKEQALRLIQALIIPPYVTGVSSGSCHLGGIDTWTEEEFSRQLTHTPNLRGYFYPPKELNWENGYKPRNIQIAEKSDEVHVITVDILPQDYTGMRFDYCYHCKTNEHVKSGGCWTAHYAMKIGKKAFWHVINNYPETN